MQKQDARVNTTTEALNNIKMLKLYSWIDQFANKIEERRKAELSILFKRFCLGMTSITTIYFFPVIMSWAVFSTFIGSGNTLDLGVAFTVITVFNLIKVSIFPSKFRIL